MKGLELMSRAEEIGNKRGIRVKLVPHLHLVRNLEAPRLRAIARHRVRASHRGLDLSLHLREADSLHQLAAL